MRPRTALIVITLSIFSLSCEHEMQISNLPKTLPPRSCLSYPLSIGVVNRSSAEGTEQYLEAIAQALKAQASFKEVASPYLPGQIVTVVAYVEVIPSYRGAGTNFFVDWPGFMIFAPAWHGYSYHADLLTRVELVSARDKKPLGRFQWVHDYEFKQADMGRSWVEVGWLEFGLIPFVGAFYAIEYDTDQTIPFIRMVSSSYGDEIARRITQELIENQTSRPEAARPPAEAN